jgi:hypothetical protein
MQRVLDMPPISVVSEQFSRGWDWSEPCPIAGLGSSDCPDPRRTDPKLGATIAEGSTRSNPFHCKWELDTQVKSEKTDEVEGMGQDGVDVIRRISYISYSRYLDNNVVNET